MEPNTAVSWTAFIAIIFAIYVAPKAYNIKKARSTKKTKVKKTLPKPAPLLGVVYPNKNKTTKRDTK